MPYRKNVFQHQQMVYTLSFPDRIFKDRVLKRFQGSALAYLLYNVKGSKSFNTCENTESVILIIPQVVKAGNKSTRHLKCRLIFSGVLRNEKPAFSKVGLECSKTLRCDEKLSQQFFERARTAGLNFQIQFCRDMQNRIFKK